MGLLHMVRLIMEKKSLEHFRKFDKIVVDDQIINQKIFSDVYYSSKTALFRDKDLME